ncbi:MAG: YqgE/AlgH family protein [Opitutaceae bacterium]|nr:YqgE/AlgH family protein [Opitutaceae bacterium]MBP9914351.1 YqgE/AlgH family protein [Opitutaceae bacterium]
MRERRSSTKKDSLAGSLLLAHPTLRDPNFRRTVVLMSMHDADGAMGVVLNRPLGKRLGELNGDFALGKLAGVPIYHGGPVKPEQLILAAWATQDDSFRLHFGLEPGKAEQLLAEPGTQMRAFLGYSGWSRGQLEKELKQDTWVQADIPVDILGQAEDSALWRIILGREGDAWRLLADEPEDPSQN